MAQSLIRAFASSGPISIPVFLAPSFIVPSHHVAFQSRHSSTTQPKGSRTRDRNRQRGVSAMRRTGPKYPLPISKEPLPEPVLDPAKRSKLEGNKDHGLWGFFDKDRKPFVEPEIEGHHGRAWSMEELRYKNFEDLHCLWWVCLKERNRLATQVAELKRVKAGYGEAEVEERDKTVKTTMKRIRHTLLERWYSYEDARKIAGKSPEYSEFFEEPTESNDDLEPSTGSEQPMEPSAKTGASPPPSSDRDQPGAAPLPA